MLRDVTIGQYYKTASPIHSLDPRTKIIALLVLMITIFTLNSAWEYGFMLAVTGGIIALSRVPLSFMLRGLKPLWMLILFTAVINLLFTGGEDIVFEWQFLTITAEGVRLAVSMVLRVVMLVVISTLLTLTTSPMSITAGLERLMKPLEKIKFPSHEVAMMMSIALRFIPTLTEEAEKTVKAQASRGNDIESGGIIKRAKAMVPLLIPMFIGAFRRADDLSMAMETRCYRGGVNRTSFKVLKYRRCDVIAFVIVILITAACMIMSILGI